MLSLEDGLKKQALLGMIYKFSSLFTAYLSVSLLIRFLGNAQYGLWVTISSLFGWITVLDMGIGSGLQNRLVKALTESDFKQARSLITTSYISMILIALAIVVAGSVVIMTIPVSGIIDTLNLSVNEIRRIMFIMLFSAGITLILKIYTNIQNALKRSSTALLTGLLSNIIYIAGLFIICKKFSSNLASVAIIRNSSIIFVFSAATLFLFRSQKNIKPSVRDLDTSLIRNLSELSIQFFIIQFSWQIINTTDNIIISNQLGSADVTLFSLVFKTVSIGKLVFFLILIPFWPQFSELYYKNDLNQMKTLLYSYGKIMVLINTAVIAVAFIIPEIIRIWTGQLFDIPATLIIFSTLFVVMDNIVGLFTYCLNAISKVKLQTYLYIFGAVLNIPLSIKLINTPAGSSGVILASCICYLPLLLMMPIQVVIELKKVKESES